MVELLKIVRDVIVTVTGMIVGLYVFNELLLCF